MSDSPGSSDRRLIVGTGIAAVAACAACCAGPVLALLGGIGAVSAIGAVWIPALVIVAVAAAGGAFWAVRRRRARACATGRGTVDLGMPTAAPDAGRVRAPKRARKGVIGPQ